MNFFFNSLYVNDKKWYQPFSLVKIMIFLFEKKDICQNVKQFLKNFMNFFFNSLYVNDKKWYQPFICGR